MLITIRWDSTIHRTTKCGLAFLTALSVVVLPARGQQQLASSSSAAPTHQRDISGLWHYEGTGASKPVAPESVIPPMTPWAKVRFNAERPGYGPRRAVGGNDPILQCD